MNRCATNRRQTSFRHVDLYREMDSFLNGLTSAESKPNSELIVPRLNVAESNERYEVSADLPGVSQENVNVEIHEGQLLISGEIADSTENSEMTFHRVERRFGKFERQVSLPENVNEQDITAMFENGVLTIQLPKSEKPKPTRIEVTSRSAE